jgi:hypothetical protein
MQHRIVISLAIASLLISGVPICWASSSSTSGVTYYVDVNHPRAEDRDDHGSIDRPWKTLKYAFRQLQPGDTLLIRGGTYSNRHIELTEANSGREDAPITVKAYPGEIVILNGRRIDLVGTRWWTFEYLIWDNPATGQALYLGLHRAMGYDRTAPAEHVVFRHCEFKNGTKQAVRLVYANHILVEDCYFHHIRPGIGATWETTALPVPYMGDDITVRNCRFEDIGSDGIQLGAQSWRRGADIGAVSIIDNEFWVNRPYQGLLGNVGENAIDIKKVRGPILISGNVIHGFRPTTPQQDCSGDHGHGITIHYDARNIIVERNLFYDNTTHLNVVKGSVGTEYGTRNIVIRNNIFKGARSSNGIKGYALRFGWVDSVEVYHNTFYENENFLRSWHVRGSLKNNVVVGGKLNASSTSEWEADYNAWAGVEEDLVPHFLRGGHDLWISNPVLGTDLHPLQDSPLVDRGQDLGIPDDFNGNPRLDGSPDVGALEYTRASQVFLPFVGR